MFATAERMAANSDIDVMWVTDRETNRGGVMLSVAPLQVWGPLRDKLLTEKTVVLTSATLKLGGDFDAIATTVGLKPAERVESPAPEREPTEGVQPWRGIDVGSPFDYGKQGILYVAAHLPRPGRDGLGAAQLDEIVDLIDAAEGRTLGLFSSRRAAEAAAEAVRVRLPHLTVLAQGDAQLPELTKQFIDDPHTCLFGTLEPVAGARPAGGDLPAGADRPDPVPAPRRPADVGAAAGRGPGRAQRLHDGVRDPRRAADGAGLRPADPHQHRPGGRRGARPAAGGHDLRAVHPGVAAADVAHHRPGGRPRCAAPARRPAERPVEASLRAAAAVRRTRVPCPGSPWHAQRVPSLQS